MIYATKIYGRDQHHLGDDAVSFLSFLFLNVEQ